MSPNTKKRIMFYISLYFAVGFILFLAQKKFIYFPTQPVSHHYKSIDIDNENFNINVIVLNSDKSSGKAIIYFGGNAETVAYNANDFIKEFPDYIVYLVNYRGYGRSTGSPDEKGIYSDALKVFDSIDVKPESIVLIGRSLGSGVATYVASKREISKLVLITPFDSIQSVAQSKLLVYPMSFLLTQKFLSAERVKHIKSKCLILIAANDEVIPFKNSINLVNSFPKNKITYKVLKNTGHNDIHNDLSYYKFIKDFLH